MDEPTSRRKKKSKKMKSDECAPSSESMNTRNITSKVSQVKSKKLQEKPDGKSLSSDLDGRQALIDKAKLTHKPSSDGGLRSPIAAVTPSSTPPPTLKRQEAKVKGVPKEVPLTTHMASAASMTTDGSDLLRRSQQPFGQPAYDKPPRLQPQQQAVTRQESFPGASYMSSGSSQLLGESYHPMLATLQAPPPAAASRTDLPRAIILPEMKQQQRGGTASDRAPQQQPAVQQLGNQFGAIGCKVPVSPPPVLNWSDSSPLLSAALMSQPPPPPHTNASNLLSSASGLSIMQQLQAERRQREEEFRRSVSSQWPGFGVEPEPVTCPSTNLTPVGFGTNYYESLWDSPQPAGGAVVSSASRRLPTEGLWGTIGQNVWPSTVLQSASTGGYGTSSMESSQQRHNQQLLQYHHMQQQQQRGVAGEEGNLLRFDSLALSSIWGDGTSAGVSEGGKEPEPGNSTWSSTLFTNKDL